MVVSGNYVVRYLVVSLMERNGLQADLWLAAIALADQRFQTLSWTCCTIAVEPALQGECFFLDTALSLPQIKLRTGLEKIICAQSKKQPC